jgi:molecular chaperone DnaJ
MTLYSLLGVSPDASAEEIERAYRHLARRFHPGINPGDRAAAARYEQIQRAYAVLGDEVRRREHDRGGPGPAVTDVETTVSFEGFDFTSPAEGPLAATFSELFADVFQEAAREAATPTRGADIETAVTLPFEGGVRGGTFPLSISRYDRCPSCGGGGRVPRPAATCTGCGGQGETRWARGHMVFMKPCEVCGGEGRLVAQSCRSCTGAGLQARSEVVTLVVPPGLESGARLAVPGRGHAGARGGPAGDLYVRVEVSPHQFFRRAGRDVHLTLPVAVHEAALGARVTVPTLDGPVQLRIPPGTPSGRWLRLKGRGVPHAGGAADGDGDLIAIVEIVLPRVRDERSRALLREFGALNHDDVRAHLF